MFFGTLESVDQEVDLEGYEHHIKKLSEGAGSCGNCFACCSEYPEHCRGEDYDWSIQDD